VPWGGRQRTRSPPTASSSHHAATTSADTAQRRVVRHSRCSARRRRPAASAFRVRPRSALRAAATPPRGCVVKVGVRDQGGATPRQPQAPAGGVALHFGQGCGIVQIPASPARWRVAVDQVAVLMAAVRRPLTSRLPAKSASSPSPGYLGHRNREASGPSTARGAEQRAFRLRFLARMRVWARRRIRQPPQGAAAQTMVRPACDA